MGVAQIWVMDPEDQKFRQYLAGEIRVREAFGEPGEAMHFGFNEVARFLPKQG